ncbi:sensor histidine kinase [Marinobacterium arenosum]|uniref:sensor histidine kinase n=1 Tax=Marinobacterium arenosum TaxID=2862496 RepID=UPI001C969D02|nr:cache domain-containing protein [Marinobacterium arenosum]MBY4675619.1 cache domain-containing protein [Marinobacterium arenosum]
MAEQLPHSIRKRLLRLALLPLLLVLPVVSLMAWLWSSELGYRQLLMKANTDLAVALSSFQATHERFLLQLALAAEAQPLRQQLTLLQQHRSALAVSELALQLERLRQQQGFDYVRLLDRRRCDLLAPDDCRYPAGPLIDAALRGERGSGIELFSQLQLQQLSPDLAEQARLPLIATEHAKPSRRTVEDRGMLLHVVYPLLDSRGRVSALLTAGLLMNRNINFVDRLKETVYGEGSLLAGSLGTVTLFLDDVRISTNVPHRQQPQRRALGTRVSAEVRAQVLERGERWLDRAFVVSDWYISGYAPISDVHGRRVGMLYSGFSEAPFKAELYRWLWQLLALFTLLLAGCVLLALRGARAIFRPIEAMAAVITDIRAGRRLRMVPPADGDELTMLARQFNQMLDQLERQHDQIQAAAEQLELKVAERTEQLRRHIALLQRTREQLVAKGKLAAIGQLTAGIAHEINNPTAVILGYLDLMMSELGEAGQPVAAEAQLIVEQVERIRAIINNLLQFSRPGDYRAPLSALDANRVVEDTRALVKHDLARKRIALRLDLRASRPVLGHRQSLQQVLINLIVNAVNAMEPGGSLAIRSRNWRDRGLLLTVRDNGCGIAAAQLERIFDPFYSQSQGGTGLGLSVSYSLLQQMDAEIDVRSRPGHGSCFYLWLQQAGEADKVDETQKTERAKMTQPAENSGSL